MLKKNNKFQYIPSLSTGSIAVFLKKHTMLDGTPYSYRFYTDEFPEQFRWDSFLITAGHFYKQPETRKDFGLPDDVLVFGDSGGYQIATGSIKWNLNIRETIFNWLEHNSDIAMNLDIPPSGQGTGNLDECLKISVDNFKYFADKQSGKTKFLNVLQGFDMDTRKKWYNEVKDFDFYGWSIGFPKPTQNLIAAVIVLLKNREFEKSKWLHFLGITSITDFYFLAHLQFLFNKHGYDVTVSTDSSTPSRTSAFANMYHSFQLKTMSFVSLSLGREAIKDLGYETNDEFLPQYVEHPYKIKFSELKDFKNDVYNKLCIHNFIILTEAYKQINSLFVLPLDHLKEIIDGDLYKVLKSLDEIFENPDQAEQVYERNLPVYRLFDFKLSKQDTSNQKELLDTLFE